MERCNGPLGLRDDDDDDHLRAESRGPESATEPYARFECGTFMILDANRLVYQVRTAIIQHFMAVISLSVVETYCSVIVN